MPKNDSLQSLAQKLHDVPRWLEVRDLLLTESGDVFGLQNEPELAFVIREKGTPSIFVIGKPSIDVIHEVTQPVDLAATVITPPENKDYLAMLLIGWAQTRIIVHHLPDFTFLPEVQPGQVDFLDTSLLNQLPIDAELRAELEVGAAHSPIAAAFDGSLPVSFCYVSSETETLWDVAIDTLPDHQRKGYATQAAAFMIRYMHEQGKQAVWQALEDNPASWKLAQKLGFAAIDELVQFQPSKTS